MNKKNQLMNFEFLKFKFNKPLNELILLEYFLNNFFI